MAQVIPGPVSVVTGEGGSFTIDASTTLTAPPELTAIANRLAADLTHQTGFPISVGDTGTIRLELGTDVLDRLPHTLGLRADDGDVNTERHSLEITADGVRIWAATQEGVFRGTTTLRQLIGTGQNPIPALRIQDAPRFAWRGFSLDTCRRFFPPDEVRQIIDLLALYKMNVLHFHLTDSEGWRIQIESWPKLTEVGGAGAAKNRPGGFYTREEYTDLVTYAAERFITIVPEIEMPGHTGAIFKAYPELAGDGSGAPVADHPMLQYLHPDHPQVPGFIRDVLTEIVEMTPGAWIHIGGDEAFGMPDDLYERFVAMARPIVPSLGKNLIAWQEATRSGVLDSTDLVQYWLEFKPESLAEFGDVASDPEGITLPDGNKLSLEMIQTLLETVQKSPGDIDRAMATGNKVIVSLSTRNYFDTPYAEESADPAQEVDRQRLGMPFYPKQTVEQFVSWDPATVHPRLPESAIVGVEGAIWCESIAEFEEAMFLILPRLCGTAERGWRVTGTTEWADYRIRLAAQAPIWERNGWPYFKSSLVDWPTQS